MPRALASAGLDVIGVGKIHDIFAGDGITETHPIASNADGMAKNAGAGGQSVSWALLCQPG